MDFNIDKKGYNIEQVDEFVKKLVSSYEGALAQQKERIFELKAALAKTESQIKTYKERSSVISKAIYNAVAKADEIEHLTQVKYSQEVNRLKAFHEKWLSYYNRIIQKYPLDEELLQVSKFNNQMNSILARAKTIDSEQAENKRINELEKTFESENNRLKEKQIGAVKVKVNEDTIKNDDSIRQILPEADLNSPILTGDFNPLERISRFLSEKSNEKDENQNEGNQNKQSSKPKQAKKSNPLDDVTVSTSGFSFEEALNPKDDLEHIIKELGLLLDEN